MDSNRIGELIHDLRKEREMTQKQLGDLIGVSDKAISKWEKGRGCPDITLLNDLAAIFQVDIERILDGSLKPNEADRGDIRKISFYVCPDCGNILTSTSGNELSCCGRRLHSLEPKVMDEAHKMIVEEIEYDYFISFSHEMKKNHYISFIACVSYERILLIRLYPEQGSEVRFPMMSNGIIYCYCTEHGLWEMSC